MRMVFSSDRQLFLSQKAGHFSASGSCRTHLSRQRSSPFADVQHRQHGEGAVGVLRQAAIANLGGLKGPGSRFSQRPGHSPIANRGGGNGGRWVATDLAAGMAEGATRLSSLAVSRALTLSPSTERAPLSQPPSTPCPASPDGRRASTQVRDRRRRRC